MASSSSNIRAKKRLFEGDANIGRIYKFKMLLPNGTTVLLTLRDPKPQMPFEEFIELVKHEYFGAWRRFEWMKSKRRIDWNGGSFYLEDANKNVMRTKIDFETFKPHKCHILKLYDGSGDIADTFENMWDLTPDTDLLMELPEEYTFETALADLIDNSLQAVWSNGENERRLISVDIADDRISIFDTGPGMDGTDENSIVKWGKMGASLHRASKGQAIGGKPPYLTPCFGMFGYGGPIASMHLGRRALVSSKTKASKEVYTLHLEKEALLKRSEAELTWRTTGGIRVPSKGEIEKSPHGSFTKVEILEPKLKNLDIFQLQCKLKDIYFPYIQCDEVSGKTSTPIQFQVDGVDLAEVEGGEVAITNLHSCNGHDFVLQLHFSLGQGSAMTKSPGSCLSQGANARLKFVYFPVKEGRESSEIIMDKLKSEGCGAAENLETFSRVSVRRLGRLLPDVRWAWLPFMDLRQRKGEKAHLLKKFCLRVKCFIDTDAGFNPTPSKTDLAHQNPFTIALKNFGVRILKEEKDINVEVRRDGKVLTPLQLEREYQDWLMQMHDYDEEMDCGVDQPTLIVSPKNKKSLGISSDVARVHRKLKWKGAMWKSGQKVKLLKGAYAGIHNSDVYATLEYFLIEGFEGDTGGEARILCRPIDVPDKNGCVLALNDGTASLDVCSSLSLPLSVVDSKKCVQIDNIAWNRQVEKQRQKSPSMIELLNETLCQKLEVNGALPDSAEAGVVPPKKIVAVVRPGSFIASSALKDLDQKDIVKNNLDMLMEIKFISEAKIIKDAQSIYSARVAPSSLKSFRGLYIFELVACKLPNLFKKAGEYIFSFSLIESSCKSYEKKVLIKGSSKVGMWELLSGKQNSELSVRVGSIFPPLVIACYDIYGNQIPFKSIPRIMVKLRTSKSVPVRLDKMKTDCSADKLKLYIKDILIENSELDMIRPLYKSTLVISSQDEAGSLSIPCRVTPGLIKNVAIQPPNLEINLLPGSMVELLKFEMFDAYHNHVKKGSEVELSLDGFCIEDRLGLRRKVDEYGFIDLGGILKVTAGYGKIVSLSLLSDNKVIFKQEFQTEKRELRVASEVPESCAAGSLLKDVTFEVVDSRGDVDITIHDDDKSAQSQTLTIKSELISTEDSIRYAFRQGRCTIPAISLPQSEGCFCFVAAHSQYPELHLSVKVHVTQAPRLEFDEIQTPCSDGRLFLREGSSPIEHVRNQMVSVMTNVTDHEDKIHKYGLSIGNHEKALKSLNDCKAETEKILAGLQASIEPHILDDTYPLLTKDEIIKRIESRDQSAAALCCFSKEFPCYNSQANFMKDVFGLVALIGTVGTNKLSRILAEYLGEEQMLALVCRSFKSACALEKYEQNGRVDFTLALHATAAAHGKSIVGRFLVICLEDIRPYFGKFEGNDHQRRLALPAPILPSGVIPRGFMGYAVNMVNLDDHHIRIRTVAGHGLRETLLYQLFGTLQVYRTRNEMIEARTCIKHGAVSLDGGILKENGIISLGNGNPTICFPVVLSNKEMPASPKIMETFKHIEELRSVLDEIMLRIERHSKAREKALKKLRKRADGFNSSLDDIKPLILHPHYLKN